MIIKLKASHGLTQIETVDEQFNDEAMNSELANIAISFVIKKIFDPRTKDLPSIIDFKVRQSCIENATTLEGTTYLVHPADMEFIIGLFKGIELYSPNTFTNGQRIKLNEIFKQVKE